MRFRRATFFWLSLLVVFIGLIAYRLQIVYPEDRERYYELLEAQPHKERKRNWDKEQELTRQTRWNVEKKMWLTKGPLRHILQIYGVRSDLGVWVVKSETHLIETFHEAKGVLQQDLFYELPDGTELVCIDEGRYKKRSQKSRDEYSVPQGVVPEPKQRFKYFEAKKAVYDFHTQTLVLHDVTFWTYYASGHALVAQPKSMTPQSVGKARSMTVRPSDVKESDYTFCAEDLQMQMTKDHGIW